MDPNRSARRHRRAPDTQDADNHHDDAPVRSPYGNTIRAVTPESIPEEHAGGAQYDHAHPASSPPTSPGMAHRGSSRSTVRPLTHRTGSGEAEFNRRNVIVESTRPRTRTLEERPRDRRRDNSPTTLFLKSRHRIGSVHSTGAGQYQALEDAVSSVHHPLAISPPPMPSARSNASGRTRLTSQQSPEHASPLPHGTAPPESLSTPFGAPDARKILHLMRTLCGRMQGQLAFRRGGGTLWSVNYCYIDEDTGALVYETKKDSASHKTLISDLRGCQAKSAYDQESYTPYLEVIVPNSHLTVHLRPPTEDEYHSWYAALLCWQPIRPKGIQNRMTKPQAPLSNDRRLQDGRRHSEVSLLKEAPIIKVGKMIFWDTNVSYSNAGPTKSSRPIVYRLQSFGSRRWRRVSCTLRENGELKLYSETDVSLVSVVQLSQLSRSAIQRLDPSVLDNEFCIAIYPQYTSTSTSISLLRPIFLSLDSRVLYEVWIVLLRAFTIPQLYGPKQPLDEDMTSSQTSISPTHDMFRMERSLSVRVIEARLSQPPSPRSAEGPRPGSNHASQSGGHFVELLLDGEIRAKTMTKNESANPFWREDFEFTDLPAIVSTTTLTLKRRPPHQAVAERSPREEHRAIQDVMQSPETSSGRGGVSFDQTLGKVDVYLDDLEPHQPVEKWWPLLNMYGHNIGEILVRVQAEESVILMARDYQPLSELLHRFSNGLTTQISHALTGQLKELSECLLNIFQVSGQAGEWIMALIEEEIDETLKDSPVARLRFNHRLASNDSSESFGSASDRELFVRDMNTNAKLEANLLFRGNTLLTKAVDFHMKRLGKEYLEETLSEKLKEINDKDPDCEVDPHRLRFQHDLERNWRKLLNLTEEVWKCIYNSANRCPTELRLVFRHVRACAEDRYGDFLRTVAYSSVSGFLFLRFFCAAVLNPKLFGLLKDHPKTRARRTLTLIAKSLQGLANLSTFGSKESWMEPMNQFLTTHRQEFRNFVDTICAVPTDRSAAPAIPPSYSTPLAILQRLPPTSREGFPSLPYLIDHAKSFADLVNLWLDHAKDAPAEGHGDNLRCFHALCVSLRQRTRECLERAERAERPGSSHSLQWEELVEQLEQSTLIDPVSTVPTSHPGYRHRAGGGTSGTGASSIASASTTPGGPYSPSSEAPPFDAATDTPPGSAGGGMDASRSFDSATSLHRPPAAGPGSTVSSDVEYPTALPRLDTSTTGTNSTTRAEKEQQRKKLVGLVGGFKKRKDRDRDRDRDRRGAGGGGSRGGATSEAGKGMSNGF